MSRIRLGIVPSIAPYLVPTNQFIIFDDHLVHVEAVSAEIAVTQSREIALYQRAFTALAEVAHHGPAARELIKDELDTARRARTPATAGRRREAP